MAPQYEGWTLALQGATAVITLFVGVAAVIAAWKIGSKQASITDRLAHLESRRDYRQDRARMAIVLERHDEAWAVRFVNVGGVPVDTGFMVINPDAVTRGTTDDTVSNEEILIMRPNRLLMPGEYEVLPLNEPFTRLAMMHSEWFCALSLCTAVYSTVDHSTLLSGWRARFSAHSMSLTTREIKPDEDSLVGAAGWLDVVREYQERYPDGR